MEETLSEFILRHVDSFDLATYYGHYDGDRRETFIHCPFHTEDTPSARFYMDGLLFCFGCNQMYSPIDFVMEFEELNYKEAIAWLEREFEFKVPEEYFKYAVSEDERNKLKALLLSFKHKIPFKPYLELWRMYDTGELNNSILNSMIISTGVI